ncbi:MAG TPA: DUF4258 domain-containing protein [Candidatus Elarobacter sp.]|jgi:uncharacterized DUF497 family protein|nr:DUF4258 domain-containing protein [Candidatus Elarobacter sp.]
MTYTDHARAQMTDRGVTVADVEAVTKNPVRGTYSPVRRDRREHFGYAADGRKLNVVTNRKGDVVITVVLQ